LKPGISGTRIFGAREFAGDGARHLWPQRRLKRFKALLAQRDLVDEWHAFADEAKKRALREWCAANEVELSE
jgi:hypothetical protein